MGNRPVWLLATLILVGACWAKFPDERMYIDGSAPDSAAVDTGVPPGETAIPDDTSAQQDNGPSDAFILPDGFTCTPGSFIQCVAKDKLQECNKQGDGGVVIDCAPFDCNATAGRCNECDPGASPTCSGKDLVSCTAAGLAQVTTCSLNCKNDMCCKDTDSDAHFDCDGDCNDNDPKVFPGQTEWQTTASNNSFDYNCDQQEELQYPDPVACQLVKGDCTGAGWSGTVPKCGDQGQLSTCVKSGPNCVVGTTAPATQGCR